MFTYTATTGHFNALIHLEYLEELTGLKRRLQTRTVENLQKFGWALNNLQVSSVQSKKWGVVLKFKITGKIDLDRIRLKKGDCVILSKSSPLIDKVADGTLQDITQGSIQVKVESKGKGTQLWKSPKNGEDSPGVWRLDKGANRVSYSRQFKSLEALCTDNVNTRKRTSDRPAIFQLITSGKVGAIDAWAAALQSTEHGGGTEGHIQPSGPGSLTVKGTLATPTKAGTSSASALLETTAAVDTNATTLERPVDTGDSEIGTSQGAVPACQNDCADERAEEPTMDGVVATLLSHNMISKPSQSPVTSVSSNVAGMSASSNTTQGDISVSGATVAPMATPQSAGVAPSTNDHAGSKNAEDTIVSIDKPHATVKDTASISISEVASKSGTRTPNALYPILELEAGSDLNNGATNEDTRQPTNQTRTNMLTGVTEVKAVSSENDVEIMAAQVPPGKCPAEILEQCAQNLRNKDDISVLGLNSSQMSAIEAATVRCCTLIQGPPGTGKTTTSVQILKQWSSLGIRPVLATADGYGLHSC